MKHVLLWVVQVFTILFLMGGLASLIGLARQNDRWRLTGLWLMTITGPIGMAVCWQMQLMFRAEDAIFWSRLMAGDLKQLLSYGSLGVIAGSGLALGGLSLNKRSFPVFSGAVFFASLWYIIYLHPTPHYVPMEPWQDKLVWFVLVVGGSIVSVFTFLRLKDYLQFVQFPLSGLAGLVSILSVLLITGYDMAQRPLPLENLGAEARIKDMGCLSCHTMDGIGFPEPGGGLESVASRTQDVVLAFMKQPDAATAKELGIRDNPTGEMAGVTLTNEEAVLLTEAMAELFEVQAPSDLGAGFERVEVLLEEKTCMACHTLNGEGAPDGGIGGPLEKAAPMELDTLTNWLIEPTLEKAIEYEISDFPTGAMASFALEPEDAKLMAEWIRTLKPVE